MALIPVESCLELVLNAFLFRPRRSSSVPAKGGSFVVSSHVVLGCGWRSGRMDARAHRQACHRRLCPANLLDGARQGSEDWMGAAVAGALSRPSRAVARAAILIIAPRFWFVAFIDFAIHITVDRAKGLCTSTFGVNQEHPWFWALIGVDQALHHLTGFGLPS